MNEHALTPWHLDVPNPRGQSTSDAISCGSSQSMASTLSTPHTPPMNQVDKSISRHSNSSSSRDASTRSTDGPWTKKYVLTLDGGGVRGLSTLLIIQHLMTLCNSIEQCLDPLVKSSFHPLPFQEGQGSSATTKKSRSAQFLPVHYFDYIAGTSTGGLIAILLSRLRMTIDDCIQEYENLGEKIFGQPRTRSMRGPIPWNREKYDHHKLEEVIKDVVKRRDWKEDQVADSVYSSNPERCRTIVFAVRVNNHANAPYLFRTYEHPRTNFNSIEKLNPGLAHSMPIWQVARATTAAPTYFKALELDDERFIDGGYGTNNPTSRTFTEVEQVHGRGSVALTLSIGTGRPSKVQPIARQKSGLIGRYRQMIKYTTSSITDSENTHENIKALLADRDTTTYERFNVDGCLGDMNLGEWRIHNKENMTLKTIREQTLAYLEQSNVRERMERIARILVENRQERSRTNKWDVVATGNRYQCPEKNCDKEMIFTSEGDLRRHLCNAHGFLRGGGNGEEDAERRLEIAVGNGRIPRAD